MFENLEQLMQTIRERKNSSPDKSYTNKLLNDKKIKVRYLFSSEEDSLRLYRMDIKEINKDDDDNKINDVILDNDVIMVWTNLNKEIQKIRFKYNGSNFLIKLNEE